MQVMSEMSETEEDDEMKIGQEVVHVSMFPMVCKVKQLYTSLFSSS